MAILSFLSGIVNSFAAFLKLKACRNRQRREAEKDVAEADRTLQEKKMTIRNAVYSKDDKTLNEIASALLAPCAVFFFLSYACIGCIKTATVYIPTDRRIESCTNSIGIACKAVPDAVMAEMLEKLQELKDLKTEKKVDKRVGQ